MGRWEPDARGRLETAAMDLYRERGFDETTVADIAARAGLTERTFFRYFTDKREVLFWGSERLGKLLVEKVAGAAKSASPMEIVIQALQATAPLFEERRSFARHRRDLIASHPELLERELIKLATLASAIGEALRRRGVSSLDASLAAEAGMAVFKLAFEAWVDDRQKRDLAQHIAALRAELVRVTRRPRRRK